MRKLSVIVLIFLITLNIYLLIHKSNNNNPIIEKEIINEIEIKTYDKYSIGDKITLSDEEWRVIDNSDESKDYVTLINLNYTRKIKNCFEKYIYLNEKKYLEGEYSNNIGIEKLKEIDGFKIRLITLDEYSNLATLTKKQIDDIKFNYSVKYKYDWVNNINTFTMTDVDYYYDLENTDNLCSSWYIQSNIRQVFGTIEGFISIQPVINIYKDKIL